jgi:ADP-ribose pyrophosphatase YjhB (NUDIX family)
MKDYVTCITSTNAIIVFNNKVLLLTMNREETKNKLWLPWWKIDENESFEEALIREIKEETWLEKENYEINKIAILQDKPFQTCKHIYEIKLIKYINIFSFDPEEIKEVSWFDFDEIPNDENLYRKPWVLKLLIDYRNWKFKNKYYYSTD